MKYKWLILLVIMSLFITNSKVALAQETRPPIGLDESASLKKSKLQVPLPSNEVKTVNTALTAGGGSIVNGNFEQGIGVGWSEYSSNNYYLVLNTSLLPTSVPPHSGVWAAWLGGDDNETSVIQQTVTIPNSATLHFSYWIDSIDDCGYDYGYIILNGNQTYVFDLCASYNTGGWREFNENLGIYGGLTVPLSFSVVTDQTNYSSFFIDDLYMYDTFVDVPFDGFAWAQIKSIYNAGITGGCSGSLSNNFNYCPNNPVTRAQMAIFLLRGMHTSAYNPPPGSGAVFGDVPSGTFALDWIEQLATEGITGGCGAGNYCPDYTVTRAQMAIFLLRAKYGPAYNPPSATGTAFTDVPTNAFAAAWIEQLVSEGITSGCGGGLYCPDSPVTRAQMAIFLQRTFGLPLP